MPVNHQAKVFISKIITKVFNSHAIYLLFIYYYEDLL